MEHLLDVVFVTERIRKLELKRWWLAEQLGIHPRTLARWLSGRTESISEEFIGKLAKLLECNSEKLTIKEGTPLAATLSEKRLMAQTLVDPAFTNLLAQRNNWRGIVTLAQGSIDPLLPAGELGKIYFLLAKGELATGLLANALGHGTAALRLARRAQDESLIAYVSATLGQIHTRNGEVALAEQHFGEAHERLERLRPTDRVHVLMRLSQIKQNRGQLDEALPLLAEARNLCSQYQLTDAISSCECQIGSIYYNLENLNLAIIHFEKAMRVGVRTQSWCFVAEAAFGLCFIRIQQKALEKARDAFNIGRKATAHLTTPQRNFLVTEVLLLLEEGNPESARDLLREALAKETDPFHRAHKSYYLARALSRCGDKRNATLTLKKAYQLAKDREDARFQSSIQQEAVRLGIKLE